MRLGFGVEDLHVVERILAIADPGADTQPAVTRAGALAKKAGAHLDLLICDYDDHLAGARFGDSDQLRQARDNLMTSARVKLEEMARPLRDDGVSVDVHTLFFHPLHEGIISRARELMPDMIVKDTHYHHVLKRTVFSNTDWELIRLCPFNLLLVKADEWPADPLLLAAVDPMHLGDKPATLDKEILAQAKALSGVVGGTLQVVHSYPVSMPAAASAAGMVMPATADLEALRVSIENAHRKALDRLLENSGIPAENVLMVPGEPRRQLVDLARSLKAAVVVTGAVSRGRLKRAFLGFTALHVLDRLPCDLMIVKLPTA